MANPSINTDWRDKAAPAGYVKRWASIKMNLLSAIASFLILLCLPSQAMAAANLEVMNVLKSHINGEITNVYGATGDLNNDGREDWVGIVLTGTLANMSQQLFVLTDNKGLEVAATSRVHSRGTGQKRPVPQFYVRGIYDPRL